MASLNRVILIGNLGKDPEIRTLNNGGRVANFSMAMGESWKDKNTGETKEKTEWANIVVFGDGLVGVIEKYVHKGSRLYIEGKFQTRMWEKDGAKHYATEVVLQGFDGKLIMLDGSKGGGGDDRAESQGAAYGGGGGGYVAPTSGSKHTRPAPDLDDEIPF